MVSFSNLEVVRICAFFILRYVSIGTLVLYIPGIIIYRVYLHPLAKYPGPFVAKVTDWYNVYHCFFGDRHLEFYRIHQKYGDFVRYGPNRISINSSTALKTIYGAKANVRKSQLFEVFIKFFPGWSTQTIRDTIQHRHAQKRRVLAQALSDSSFKSMEQVILENIWKFCAQLIHFDNNQEDEWSKAVDVAHLANHLSFDIMGTVCFGKSFEMLENPANRYILDVLSDGAQCLNTLGHMQGILNTGIHKLLFRSLLNGLNRYKSYSKKQCDQRVADPSRPENGDVFQCLLDAKDVNTGLPLFTHGELQSESSLLIVAGSDTVSTCIASTIFYLIYNPAALSTAQNEIRKEFEDIENIRIGPKLSGCNYLRACIREALRLSPPVGGLMPREILPGGLEIDGHMFLEGIEVGTPHYAIHHNELYFSDPFAFKPARWLKSGDLEERSKAESAFCAFSIGPRNCVGQTMAYHELMLVLSRVLWLYDMRLFEGSSLGQGGLHLPIGRQRTGEYQLEDSFASRSKGPMVQFRHAQRF